MNSATLIPDYKCANCAKDNSVWFTPMCEDELRPAACEPPACCNCGHEHDILDVWMFVAETQQERELETCETCGQGIVHADECVKCQWCGEPLCAKGSGKHYADCDCCHGPNHCPARDGEEVIND